jgi:hypothetical protein
VNREELPNRGESRRSRGCCDRPGVSVFPLYGPGTDKDPPPNHASKLQMDLSNTDSVSGCTTVRLLALTELRDHVAVACPPVC